MCVGRPKKSQKHDDVILEWSLLEISESLLRGLGRGVIKSEKIMDGP